MKAAIVEAAGKVPFYGDVDKPVAQEGEELVEVRAAALSNFSKSRSLGQHYPRRG